MDGVNSSSVGTRADPSAERVVKLEQPIVDSHSTYDLGARIAEAVAELSASGGTGGKKSAATDEHIYWDPAPLKWKIFEAVAKANGQRSFETYWSALRNFVHGWLPREGLEEAINTSLGADNVHLHNELILCILNNARCRYLPADLVSQVPASFRGKVVHAPTPNKLSPRLQVSSPSAPLPATTPSSPPAPRRVALSNSVAPLPSSKNGLSSSSAATSLHFQGKRTEGLLLNAEEYAAAANGRVIAVESKEPPMHAKYSVELEAIAGGLSVSTAAAPPARDRVSSPGGERRRDDDRLRPGTESGGEMGDNFVEQELSREAQLLEDEIESHFGAGSDLWYPWSRGGSGPGEPDREWPQPLQSVGRKRPASTQESHSKSSMACHPQSDEIFPKALKRECGAAAVAGGSDSAANGGAHSRAPALFTRAASGQQVLELAAARAGAEQLSPSHQSQRVPGARALAPFLQALTASQQMRVSHEVCRVMTAGVKEYLRRVIEACLVNAREERRRGPAAAAGVNGTPSTGNPSTTSNGAITTVSMKQATPLAAAAPAGAGVGREPIGGVLMPGHLQTALETTPRLVGPSSSARAQWRRVATYAGGEHQCLDAARGLARSGGEL